MKHIVMGMAGHVDHGKTALVYRLTNVDTDRLKEEKQRGMTIELGFAPFLLPDGRLLSIIDVPGHERFIKTMVAGVMGIDLVLLVVAADEGIMPQTREHLDIIDLLGVGGVVALTKIDLVEEDWLEMVREEIRGILHGTALAGAKIVPVSAKTGEGIPKLLETIINEVHSMSTRMMDDTFRLPIDRVFTAEGYGTIITGTVYGGRLERGAKVMILPQGLETRVRGLQVHGEEVDMVIAGDRCALNLTGITSEDIKRGDTVAHPGQLEPSSTLDAVLSLVKTSPAISQGQRVRLHLATSEVMARVRIIGADEIVHGTQGYVQIRTEEPIVAQRDDKFIIRSYSPVVTIGGGRIVLANAPRRRRYNARDQKEMELEAAGSGEEILQVLVQIERRQLRPGISCIAPLVTEELSRKAHLSAASVEDLFVAQGWVELNGKYLPRQDYRVAGEAVALALRESYNQAPFRLGIDKEELKYTLFPQWGRKEYGVLLEGFVQDQLIVVDGRWVSEHLAYHRLLRTGHPALLRLEAEIHERKYQGYQSKPMGNTVTSFLGIPDVEISDIPDMIALLIHTGKVVDVGYGLVIHKCILDQALDVLKQHLTHNTSITVGQFRDILQTNRKVAMALLEYFDGLNVTRRQGNERIIVPNSR